MWLNFSSVADEKIRNTQAEITRIRKEILDLTLYGEIRVDGEMPVEEAPVVATPEKTAKNSAKIHKTGHRNTRAGKNEPIFSESDLEEAPMPSK